MYYITRREHGALDITSPITLWKEYDVTTLPLNTSALSKKTENGICVKEFYFDGYTTVDGRVRAFVKIAENPQAKGVILFLKDMNAGVSDEIGTVMYELGYTIATLDYLGKNDDRAHYTLYPRSLDDCNSYGVDRFDVAADEKYSRWYIWTCIARRAHLFLKQQYEALPIFALGVGLGGSTVYKLSAFDDGPTACATLLNIIPNVVGDGNAIINYHASLDNYAYASISKLPLFMAIATNDADGSLDDMSDLADNTQSLKHFRILERAFAPGISAVCPDLDKFFTNSVKNTEYFSRPQIEAVNSDGSLYLNINTTCEKKAENSKLKLFLSFCVDDVPFRNWMEIPSIGLGDGKFMAQINVCRDDKPLYAFANLISESGDIQSTPMITVMPKSLNIHARGGVAHRKIYDGSMGKDCWTSRIGGKISLIQGPYGIDGVTSDKNSLLTFKPGDPLFKVPADTILQIMASGKPQTLNVKVCDKTNIYTCKVEITMEEAWHKFSLSHENFKSATGTLTDWSQIVTLEFESDEQFIIGSALWV